MRGCRNKSPTKLNVVENKINTSDLFTNRENHQGKTPPCEFKVTTLENPLISKQAITSKGILITYINLQLNPNLIHNWTCNIVTISPFNARLLVRD